MERGASAPPGRLARSPSCPAKLAGRRFGRGPSPRGRTGSAHAHSILLMALLAASSVVGARAQSFSCLPGVTRAIRCFIDPATGGLVELLFNNQTPENGTVCDTSDEQRQGLREEAIYLAVGEAVTQLRLCSGGVQVLTSLGTTRSCGGTTGCRAVDGGGAALGGISGVCRAGGAGSLPVVQSLDKPCWRLSYAMPQSPPGGCAAGSGTPGGGLPCRACIPGEYGAGGFIPCIACPPGSTTLAHSQPGCVCIPGYGLRNSSAASARQCVQCPEGYYSQGGTYAPCTRCPGKLTSIAGATSQAFCVCPAGTGVTTNASACALCPIGKYQPGPGMVQLLRNSSATPSNPAAFAASTALFAAVGIAGSAPLANSRCISCGANFTTERVGATSVLECRLLSNVNGTKNSTCQAGAVRVNGACACGAGFEPTSAGCVLCNATSYKPAAGNTSCIACNGTSSTNRTSCEANTCQAGAVPLNGACACGAGFEPTSAGCALCNATSYKPAAGNSSCIACDGTSSTNRTSCEANTCQAGAVPLNGACACGAGFEPTSAGCALCNATSYKPAAGNSSCIACDGTSSTNRTSCEAASSRPAPRTSSCVAITPSAVTSLQSVLKDKCKTSTLALIPVAGTFDVTSGSGVLAFTGWPDGVVIATPTAGDALVCSAALAAPDKTVTLSATDQLTESCLQDPLVFNVYLG